MKVQINNEYQRLREVVLGLATTLYFPDHHDIETEAGQPWWKRTLNHYLYPLIKGRKVPKWLIKKYEKEAEAFIQVLLAHGVKIRRVLPVVPQLNEPLGLGQMFVRDQAFCVGSRLLIGQLKIAMRQKERRGFTDLMAACDADQLAQLPVGGEAYLEGGDVVVDWPYVYVGIGQYASNEKGVQWLQGILGGEVTVVPVYLQDRGVLHLDCCLTLIGPQLGIIHRASLSAPLPYPLNTYEFIEVDALTRAQMGTNNLLLDDKTIVVQARHHALQQALKQKGYTVVPVDFTWHARLDGAFRCATCPTHRSE